MITEIFEAIFGSLTLIFPSFNNFICFFQIIGSLILPGSWIVVVSFAIVSLKIVSLTIPVWFTTSVLFSKVSFKIGISVWVLFSSWVGIDSPDTDSLVSEGIVGCGVSIGWVGSCWVSAGCGVSEGCEVEDSDSAGAGSIGCEVAGSVDSGEVSAGSEVVASLGCEVDSGVDSVGVGYGIDSVDCGIDSADSETGALSLVSLVSSTEKPVKVT